MDNINIPDMSGCLVNKELYQIVAAILNNPSTIIKIDTDRTVFVNFETLRKPADKPNERISMQLSGFISEVEKQLFLK